MIHRFILRYTLIKPPDLQSKQASFAIRFAALWYSVLQISPGWIPSLQLTHFSITANPITSDSYLPSSVHICHLPHGSHPAEKLISIFMLEKLWTRVFMGTWIYYLCAKRRDILMDKMDEQFKQMKSNHEWITEKGYTSPPVHRNSTKRNILESRWLALERAFEHKLSPFPKLKYAVHPLLMAFPTL